MAAKEKNKKDQNTEEKDQKLTQEEVPDAAEPAAETKPEEGTTPEAELKAQLEEMRENYLRQVAEFDNFRKRTAKEKEETYTFALAKCINELLPVMDNFERALACETTDENYKKGIEMIHTQLSEMLKKLGVTEIEAEGKPFDPELHNAVSQKEDDSFGENTVCQVFQKGYRIGDRVIRHAMVVVANP